MVLDTQRESEPLSETSNTLASQWIIQSVPQESDCVESFSPPLCACLELSVSHQRTVDGTDSHTDEHDELFI